jgi:hypothetical protein
LKILFTLIGNSRRSNYLTGDTIRNGGGGGSGTDGSTILVAEYLASKGLEVVVLSDKLEPALEKKYREQGNPFTWGSYSRGVQYSNFQMEGVSIKEFDILVNSLWFQDYKNLPVKITKGVVYWCHMQWLYGMGEIINFVKENNLKLGIVNISQWERSQTQGCIDGIKNAVGHLEQVLIPNPIMDDLVREVKSLNIQRKPHKFIFLAAWARGGNVAMQAVRELPFEDKEFHAFDYLMATHRHPESYFNLHDGVDKKTLFQHLAESEYFIYPLYTPYEDVHKDTFSCVVAEAIALGTSVLTYPLGALPEYYDGYVHWLDFPEGTDPVQMQKESLSKDLQGKFKCTNNIVNKINYLENNPQAKQHIKNNGTDFILNNFNIAKVGSMWEDLLNKLVYL